MCGQFNAGCVPAQASLHHMIKTSYPRPPLPTHASIKQGLSAIASNIIEAGNIHGTNSTLYALDDGAWVHHSSQMMTSLHADIEQISQLATVRNWPHPEIRAATINNVLDNLTLTESYLVRQQAIPIDEDDFMNGIQRHDTLVDALVHAHRAQDGWAQAAIAFQPADAPAHADLF